MSVAAPLISVCIANFNGERIIEACLESVRNQDLDGEVEIIVHDDASSDESPDIIERRFPGVQLIRSSRNVGFCKANNRMARAARGEYLLLLNNDAVLLPDALRVLEHHARTGRCDRILTLPQYDIDSRALIDSGRRIDCSLNPVPRTDVETGDVAMCIGACLWIPRSLWDELEGFPEWFESIGEDLFLCVLAWRAGYRVTAIGESGYYHHVGFSFGGSSPGRGAGLTSSLRRRRLSEVNRIRAMAILLPGLVRWPALTLHLAGLAVEALVLVMIRCDVRLWRNLYWIALQTPVRDRVRIRKERARVGKLFRQPVSRLLPHVDWIPYKARMLFRHGIPRIEQ